MSSINGIGNTGPIHTVVNQPILRSTPAEAGAARSIDRLELSGASHLLQSLKANADIRVDKVASIKAQIDAGTYDQDARLDVAIDRLLDDLDL